MKNLKNTIEKGKDFYNIIYAKNNYCLINAKNKFYYIEKNQYNYNIKDDYTITLYNKINANIKHQADYPKGVNNLNDILNYIEITKNKKYNNLKDAPDQVIFYQLNMIINKKTMLKHLQDIAGYRENYILKNLDRIEEIQDDDAYNILKFIDIDGNFFQINIKNINRLIIG